MKNVIEIEKQLVEYDGEDRVVSFAEKIKELSEQPKGFTLHCGLFQLDELINGFVEGELILVSGRPKGGKTTFLQTLTSHFADIEERVCWFSYEVPPRQFLESFPELPEGYMPRRMELSNIWWLEKRVYESKLKYGTRVVMVDHLHYLVDMSKLRNASIEIGNIYRRLKLLAIKYKIIIFLVSHLRKVESGVEPQAEDIRDSNFALGEPDTVLMLWRVADNSSKGRFNQAYLKIEMTRRTGILQKKIKLQKVDGLLEEMEWKEA